MSMKPGVTMRPVASSISAPLSEENFPGAPSSLMTPPSSRTSIAASVLDAGSRTRPFRIRSMLGILLCGDFVRSAAIVRDGLLDRGMRAVFRGSRDEQVQNCHAHRDAVCDLLEDAGLRTVGNFRRDFDSTIHRPGM